MLQSKPYNCSLIVLLVWFDSLPPNNYLSVRQGSLIPSVSSEALYYYATALPLIAL